MTEGQEEDLKGEPLKGEPLEGELQKGEIGGKRTSVPCSAMCAPLLGIDGWIAPKATKKCRQGDRTPSGATCLQCLPCLQEGQEGGGGVAAASEDEGDDEEVAAGVNHKTVLRPSHTP